MSLPLKATRYFAFARLSIHDVSHGPDVFSAAQQLSRVRNEITALDLQKQGNLVRLEKLSAEKIQLEEERARLEQRLSEFAANVQADKLSAQTRRGTAEDGDRLQR